MDGKGNSTRIYGTYSGCLFHVQGLLWPTSYVPDVVIVVLKALGRCALGFSGGRLLYRRGISAMNCHYPGFVYLFVICQFVDATRVENSDGNFLFLFIFLRGKKVL